MDLPLGDRMKLYEGASQTRLVPQMPVIARLDGKAFHTLTSGLIKPYDEGFQRCMWETARALCEQIQGCRLAYVQSDEISLLLVDYESYKTQPWFNYEIQKMCSVGAGLATEAFNEAWRDETARRVLRHRTGAFDARFWNLPPHEVCNYFIWRQQDATRNSIAGLAQAHFSHKELHGKNSSAMQEMLFADHSVNWNDCPTPQKRGVCVRRIEGAPDVGWRVDLDIPIFSQDRRYVDRCLPELEF